MTQNAGPRNAGPENPGPQDPRRPYDPPTTPQDRKSVV